MSVINYQKFASDLNQSNFFANFKCMTEIVGFDFAARIRGIALKLGSCKRGKYYETFFGLVCCHLQFFG